MTPRNLTSSRAQAALLAVAGSVLFGALTSACSSPATTTPPPAARLWGDFKPVVSVRELMRDMIDPLADNIFMAVSSVTTKQGTVDSEPKTDEDWQKVRTGAVALAEGIYLLKVPRPFTPPGEDNNITGPDVVELSAAQITEKVERDPVEWNARIEATRNAALAVLELVKKKDASGLWAAGEDLDTTCEACHRSYWYPGENAAFYGRLRERLKKAQLNQPPTTPPAAPQKP